MSIICPVMLLLTGLLVWRGGFMKYKFELYEKKVGESQWEVKVNDQRLISLSYNHQLGLLQCNMTSNGKNCYVSSS